MAAAANSSMSWILMFFTPTIWSTSKSSSSKTKATRPRRLGRVFEPLIVPSSQIVPRIGDLAFDRCRRDGRGIAQIDFGIVASHAAAHIERAGRDGPLLRR